MQPLTRSLLSALLLAARIAFAAGTACPAGYGISTQVSSANGKWSVTTSGCPGYDPTGQTTGNTPTCQNKAHTFSITPTISSSVTWISITFANGSSNPAGGVKGPIGYAMNGVSVYGDADALDRDAYVYEGSTFDACRGHAAPGGDYHYHTMPAPGCVYNDTVGQHSPVFALMADGIPLYGQYGDAGAVPTDLDVCGGHTDSSYSFYHYHLPNGLVSPYTVRCLRGCVSLGGPPGQSSSSSTCTAASTQYDYSSLSVPWQAGYPAGSGPCATGSASSAPPPSLTPAGAPSPQQSRPQLTAMPPGTGKQGPPGKQSPPSSGLTSLPPGPGKMGPPSSGVTSLPPGPGKMGPPSSGGVTSLPPGPGKMGPPSSGGVTSLPPGPGKMGPPSSGGVTSLPPGPGQLAPPGSGVTSLPPAPGKLAPPGSSITSLPPAAGKPGGGSGLPGKQGRR